MNLEGIDIFHRDYGLGNVISHGESYITIKFEKEDSHLRISNADFLRNVRILSINSELESYIFQELGGVYAIDPKGVKNNLCNDYEKCLAYLGTYFPRSYIEAYNIFSNLLSNWHIRDIFKYQGSIDILDFGSGSGGNVFGLIDALKNGLILDDMKIRIFCIDGNRNMLTILDKIFHELYEKSNIELTVIEKEFGGRDDFEREAEKIIRQYQRKYDIITSFKFVSEFYNDNYSKNSGMYRAVAEVAYNNLKEKGLIVIEDITTKIDNSNELQSTRGDMYIPALMKEEIVFLAKKYKDIANILPVTGYFFCDQCTRKDCFTQVVYDINYRTPQNRFPQNSISKVTYRVLTSKEFADALFEHIEQKPVYKISPTNSCPSEGYRRYLSHEELANYADGFELNQ